MGLVRSTHLVVTSLAQSVILALAVMHPSRMINGRNESPPPFVFSLGYRAQ